MLQQRLRKNAMRTAAENVVIEKFTYQAIDNTVVLCTSHKNYLSNDSHNKIDGNGFPKVVQRTPIKKQSSCLHNSIKKIDLA